MKNEALDQLRSLLEGHKVVHVLPPHAPEAICKLVLDNGTAFRLHATDLGFWIEKTVVSPDTVYQDMNSLVHDFYHYTYCFPYDDRTASATVADNLLTITARDGTQFRGDVSKFSDWEQLVLNDTQGLPLFQECLAMGDLWRLGFTQGECPDHLAFHPKE